eukprot:4615342-Prymnesium_polylepis.1
MDVAADIIGDPSTASAEAGGTSATGAEASASSARDPTKTTETVHRAADMLEEAAHLVERTTKRTEGADAATVTEAWKISRKACAAIEQRASARVSEAVQAATVTLEERLSQGAPSSAAGAVAASDGMLSIASSQVAAAGSWLREAVDLLEAATDRMDAALPDLLAAGTAASTSALHAAGLDGDTDQAQAAREEWQQHCASLDEFLKNELQWERIAALLRAPIAALASTTGDDDDDDDGNAATSALAMASDAAGEAKEAINVALQDLKLHVVGTLAEEAKASVEELAEAASAKLDEVPSLLSNLPVPSAHLCLPRTLRTPLFDSECQMEEGFDNVVGEGSAAAVVDLVGRAVERASLSAQASASRVREVAAAAALALVRRLRLLDGAGAASLRSSLMEDLVAHQVRETSPRVKALLGCKDRGPTETELAHAWDVQQKQLKREMQQRLKRLEEDSKRADELSDPLEKQLALDACRAERRALAAAAKGCSDVGEKLNVVLDFLVGFQDELEAINSRLGALQGAIGALHEALDRALGRPVLD